MLKSIAGVFRAIKIAQSERNRQKRQFRQKRNEIYREGLVETKLREQLAQIVSEMYADPSIISVKIEIARNGVPFASSILSQLECEVVSCGVNQYRLYPRDSYI